MAETLFLAAFWTPHNINSSLATQPLKFPVAHESASIGTEYD